jgi:O-antigen ligase
LHRPIGVLLLLLLALAPLPYASNRDWAWSLLAFAVGVLLLAYSALLAIQKDQVLLFSKSMAISAIAMAIVVCWGFVQIAPWNFATVTGTFFSSLPDALDRPLPVQGTIDRERTLTAIMKLVTYGAVFWLATQLGRDNRYARNLCATVVITAVVVTIYGLVMEASTRSCIVLALNKRPPDVFDPCTFSGTFVNSGNYAMYAGIACIICLAWLQELALGGTSHGSNLRERWRARLLAMGGRGAVYLAALVVLLGGLIYSASRAGLVSFLAAALFMAVITSAFQGRLRGGTLSTIVAVFALTIAMLAVTGEAMLRRYLGMLDGGGDEGRLALYSMTLDAIGQRPWMGWGLGSFEPLYSIFQPVSLAIPFDKAHSVYLENASDIGIVGSALLTLAIFSPASRCLLGLRERNRDIQYSAAALGASVFVGLHSIVDFGIQIPATAATFSALLGVGWAQSWSSRRQSASK